MPFRAHASAVTCAANGVDLREPLKPAEPADSHAITLPSLSVSATIVLLKLVLMCAWPIAMFFLALRRVRPRVAACLLGGATLLRLRLAAADGLLRALAGARVRLRALTMRRQPTPVAEVALDLELGVDVVAELRDLVVGEVADLRVGREAERGRDLVRGRLADPIDIGQPDLEPLLVRQVDAGDARHGLALPLLVAGIRADDQDRAVPLDDAAAL